MNKVAFSQRPNLTKLGGFAGSDKNKTQFPRVNVTEDKKESLKANIAAMKTTLPGMAQRLANNNSSKVSQSHAQRPAAAQTLSSLSKAKSSQTKLPRLNLNSGSVPQTTISQRNKQRMAAAGPLSSNQNAQQGTVKYSRPKILA